MLINYFGGCREGITQAFIAQEMADLKHYALAKWVTEAVKALTLTHAEGRYHVSSVPCRNLGWQTYRSSSEHDPNRRYVIHQRKVSASYVSISSDMSALRPGW
jgi:hypothetical protein